jgi:hypothetical protein
MKNKHSIGWLTVKDLTQKIKIQRAIIIGLTIALAILSVWLCISGGK